MSDNHATASISIDLELGWGLRDRPDERRETFGSGHSTERQYLGQLLDLCTELSIPITFATVGRLFDEGCRITKRLERRSDDSLIYSHSSTNAKHYHASELVELIREHPVPHEIGTHTFSHVLCDEVSETTLDKELRAVRTLHEDIGLDPPQSFVAPRNRLPEYGILADHGIQTVRIGYPAPSVSTGQQLLNVLQVQVGSMDPLTHTQRRRNGVTEVVSTSFPSLTALSLPAGQRPAPLPVRCIPRHIRQRAHTWGLTRALDRAIERNGDLHLWSHLFNFSNPAQWEPIEAFLQELARRRDRGEITVRTMNEYGERGHRRSRSN